MGDRLVRSVACVAAFTALAGATMLTGPAAGAAGSPINLVIPGSNAFSILGHDCGGISQHDFGTQFDPTSGYPDGAAYLWTVCSAGGRGGHSVTISAWVAATWDYTGGLVSTTVLGTAPSVDPALSVTDLHGNTLANASNQATLTLAATFTPPPRVAGISPAAAPQGTTVTVTGTGFTGATQVLFGTSPATIVSSSGDTSITVIAPAIRQGPVDVSVTGPGGTSPAVAADQFTFTQNPRVASLSPTSGSCDGGTVVVIRGVNFTGTTLVTFGGLRATHVKVMSDTKIKATSPTYQDPAVVDVVVSNPYGYNTLTPADQFTYTN